MTYYLNERVRFVMNQENKYALRRIKYQGTYMINICDLNLVDKVINKGDFAINISKEYFHDEEIDEEEAASLLKSSSMLNLVGKNVVALALRLKLAKENSVKVIEDVPFLMVFSFLGNY
jgi:uncharacterized protein